MTLDPDPTLEPLADPRDVAELIQDHPDLATMQSWDGGFFYEMALFIARYDVTSDADAMATVLHRFDSADHRASRARALRRGGKKRRTR